MIRHLLVSLLVASSSLAADAPSGAPTTAAPPVRSLLLASLQAVAPGDTVLLGLMLEPAPGWHLYWRGLNDSGLPPQPELRLPAGAELLEDWRWPAPERLVAPGGILDHVYPGRLVLTAALRLPAQAPAGDHYSVNGRVSWVACKEACRFGSDSLSLRLSRRAPGAPPQPSVAAERIARARAALPAPLAPGQGGLGLHRGERSVLVEMPGASELAFFPERDCVPLLNPLADGEVLGARLNLRLAQGSMARGRLHGILSVLAGTERRHYLLDTPLDAIPLTESDPTKE